MYGVAAAHTIAVEAGMRALKEGGDACDAAVAVNLALGVSEPFMSGIGGGGGSLIWRAKERKAYFLNFHTRCSRHARPDMFSPEVDARTDTDVQACGHLAPLVPGMLRGLEAVHGRFGRLPWARLFEDAVAAAEDGYPVYPFYRKTTSSDRFRALAERLPELRRIHSDEGRTYPEGHILRQPEYAETLRRISKEGPALFYEGEIGRAVAEEVKRGGGILDAEDLAEYRPQWLEPLPSTYRGKAFYTSPPPFAGIALIMTLNMLEYAVPDWETFSEPARRIAYAKALQAAQRDRFAHLGDPNQVEVPVARLSSKEYAAERMEEAGMPAVHAYVSRSSETTHFSVVDAEGNAVAQTQSLGSGFGSGVGVPGTGIFLNNFSNWLDPRPDQPSCPAPRRYVVGNHCPTLFFEGERLRLVVGSPGSYRIAGAVAQTIINRFDRGMALQEAVSAPRIHIDLGDLEVEEGALGAEEAAAVREAGFEIRPHSYPDHFFGGVHAVEIHEDGSLSGANDPRRAGTSRVDG